MNNNQENQNTDEIDISEDTLVVQNENETSEDQAVETTERDSSDELAAMKDKYLRLLAEFENYKRRSSKERIEYIGTASKEMIVSLLPVLDDFERADSAGAVTDGMKLIYHKLQNIVLQKGLKMMDSNGQPFDADFHEAITEVAMGEEMKGKVIDTVEKGYLLNDKIIRYAKVVVGA
ncbi:MAG: nucleotide exchange factor GrpE [Saprospiraceae bacterium]